ncbi:hypothetical protein ARMGADRAFT_1026502 [Armillaria gallica]|uniref:Uncharacterized protein n=1 Tax=Armillaria gallica TaxID=47427 RepID=A0A2H3E467_ARMGA|nr:hypothetical protein ARMGADRAFT_1026502 [Armillaria gallica]
MPPAVEGPVNAQEMKNGPLFTEFPLQNPTCLHADSFETWWQAQELANNPTGEPHRDQSHLSIIGVPIEGSPERIGAMRDLGRLIASTVDRNTSLAGLMFPESRTRTLGRLAHYSEARRKPCVDALLMLKIMDALTVTLGQEERTTYDLDTTKGTIHKDLQTTWRLKAEQTSQPVRHTRPTNLMDQDERLWCDILSLQEQSVHDKKAHWAKVVQSFERVAWEMRFLIWEKDEDVFEEHGYLYKLRKVANQHGIDQSQWQEIEHLLRGNSGGGGCTSYKRQLAAVFGVSALTLLRGVEACPPFFDCLVFATRVPMHTKPPLLQEVELAFQRVLFGTAAGAFRAEPALKAVLDHFHPIITRNCLTQDQTLWFPHTLEQAAEDGTAIQASNKTLITTPVDLHSTQGSTSNGTTISLSDPPRRSLRNRKPPIQEQPPKRIERSAAPTSRTKRSRAVPSNLSPESSHLFLSQQERTQILKNMETQTPTEDVYHQLLLKAGPIKFGKLRATALVPVIEIPCRKRARTNTIARSISPLDPTTQRAQQSLQWTAWSVINDRMEDCAVNVSVTADDMLEFTTSGLRAFSDIDQPRRIQDQARRNILVAASLNEVERTEGLDMDLSEEECIEAPLKQMLAELVQSGGGRILHAHFPIPLSTFSIWQTESVILEPGTQLHESSFLKPNTLHYVITEQPSIVYHSNIFASSTIQSTVMGWTHSRILGTLVGYSPTIETQAILVRMMCVWARQIQSNIKGKYL